MRRPSLMPRVVLTATVLAAAVFARPAQASPNYPPIVRDSLGLSCTPQCIVCHDTNEGGFGTLNTFGLFLQKKHGAIALNDDSIRKALAGLKTDMPPDDADHDGVDDLTELAAGDLPGSPGDNGRGLACSAVRYGCGARVAPSLPQSQASLVALSAVLLFVAARLRRRRRTGP
jgi:mono/diheme cytochrome c family protein